MTHHKKSCKTKKSCTTRGRKSPTRKTTSARKKPTTRKPTTRKPTTRKPTSARKKTERKPVERKPTVRNATSGVTRPSARYSYDHGMKVGTAVTYSNGEKKCLKLVGANKTPKFLKC